MTMEANAEPRIATKPALDPLTNDTKNMIKNIAGYSTFSNTGPVSTRARDISNVKTSMEQAANIAEWFSFAKIPTGEPLLVTS